MIPLHDDNPTEITPVVTIALIAACAVAFLWQQALPDRTALAAVYSYGMIPSVLFDQDVLAPELYRLPAEVTVFTSMFLHGGWMHIIGNMLFLWVFGNNIEDAMGHVRFALFYALCGVAAALAQALSEPGSDIPMIGASGAVSGVLAGYLLLHPHARVLTMVIIIFFIRMIRLPAWVLLGLWIVMQLYNAAVTPTGEAGVAWMAHVGGFVAGLALIGLFKRRDIPFFGDGGPPRGRGPWG